MGDQLRPPKAKKHNCIPYGKMKTFILLFQSLVRRRLVLLTISKQPR